MNKIELHLKYKNETSYSFSPMTVYAKISLTGNVVIDKDDCDERIFSLLDKKGFYRFIDLPDPEYHKWLEDKVMELLKPDYDTTK